MPKRKAPAGCFWRGEILWARKKVAGLDHKWSLRTGDAEVAKRRRKADVEKLIARVRYGDDRKTYDEAFAAWSEHIVTQVSANTAKRYGVSLGQLAKWLRPLFVDEIDKPLLRRIVTERRAAGASTATIKRDLVALSSLLEYAEDEDWIASNPALARQKKLKERRQPIALPDPDDIRRVIARLPGMLATLADVAWRTGCRLEELAGAKRRQADTERKELTIRGKRGKVRVIDLEPFGAHEVLRSLPAALAGAWLFWHDGGERYRNVSSRFRFLVAEIAEVAAQKGEQFRAFRFHDLRHRHAVEWLQSGRSIYDLQQRLGHSSIKTTEAYLAYLTPEQQRVAKLGAGPQKGERVQRSGDTKSAATP